MKLNSPMPQSLQRECEKAAKIFKSFVNSKNNGLDGVIPRSVLAHAKGFAIFTIVKAGFIFSARMGSGVVIAKVEDGSWSAPSAIGTAGIGGGVQVGAEMTDILIVLNSRGALRSFMAAGSLTIGGNLSVAVGPLGRNGEASGTLNTKGKIAAMYSYSKTRGLFGGLSIEGSVIVERQDANAIAYGSPVSAQALLSGRVDRPRWASNLINTIEGCTGAPGNRAWIQADLQNRYLFEGTGSALNMKALRKKKKDSNLGPSYPSFGSADSGTASTLDNPFEDSHTLDLTSQLESRFDSGFDSDVASRPSLGYSRSSISHQSSSSDVRNSPNGSTSLDDPVAYRQHIGSISKPTGRVTSSVPFDRVRDGDLSGTHQSGKKSSQQPHEGIGRAVALYHFQAVEPGDLSFSKGDVIVILRKSKSTDDWWTGKIGNREGIFPANFVEVA